MKVGESSLTGQLNLIKNLKQIDSVSNKSFESDQISQGQSFGEMLMQKYDEANRYGVEAEQAIQRSVLGEDQNPHEAVIAVQKASVSLTLMLGIKERLERAYQDLIKTPI
jgi:flagellar hook-basal body complex protein FliE